MKVTDYSTGRNYSEGSARQTFEKTDIRQYDKTDVRQYDKETKAQQSVKLPKKPTPLRKKKLNYNSREIRAALLRAVRSQTAGLVLNTAKSKLVSLLKCKGTGMYNENELNAAIGHARRMVRCARLKLQNLTKEEQQSRRNAKAMEREAKDPGLEQVQKTLRLKQRKLALEQKRRMHRNLELAKLDQADEEYRHKQARNQREREKEQNATACSRPNTGGRDLSELKLQELELEMSREEAMLEMEAADSTDAFDEIQTTLETAIFSESGSLSMGAQTMSPSAEAAGQTIDIGL